MPTTTPSRIGWETGAPPVIRAEPVGSGGLTWAAALLGGSLSLSALAIADFGPLPAIVFAGTIAAATATATVRVARTVRALAARAASAERHARALEPGGGAAAWTWHPAAYGPLGEPPAWFSPRWTSLFAIEAGRQPSLDPWLERVHPEDLGGLIWVLDHLRLGRETMAHHTFRIGSPPDWRWAELRATRVDGPDGIAITGVVQDVTASHIAHERLTHTAYHDALTGLPNRALLLDRLAHGTARARRNPRYRFALVYLDVDGFKRINDSLGHEAGDTLLVAVADRLARTARTGDTVARIGGDEFCVLLDPVADASDAERLARTIGAAICDEVEVGGQRAQITSSVGIALSNSEYDDAIDVLRDADTAMYHAKQDGDGRVRVFDHAMRASALRRLWVEREVRAGLEGDGFWVAFQPIVELGTARVVGFEALARLRSSSGEAISPAEFIPCAEARGLIDRVLDRVLDTTACRLAEWSTTAPQLYVSVNVSARSVNAGLVDRVVGVLERHRLRPEQLKLELTESLLVGTSTQTPAALDALCDAGIGLFIDDFGTGFSSLSYLHQFRVEKIKLDRSFVSALDGRRMPDIVHTIVALAERIGAGVVAEGIETHTQLVALRALGCHAGQGYLFSAPVPAVRAVEFLLAQNALHHTPAPAGWIPHRHP